MTHFEYFLQVQWGEVITQINTHKMNVFLPIPGEAKAEAMPGRLYIHTRHNNNKNIKKTTFVSYLNSPRKGCPRGKNIWVWTHLGLIKWKTTSKKIRNGRRPQKKMEDDLKKIKINGSQPKKNGRRPKKKMKKNGR